MRERRAPAATSGPVRVNEWQTFLGDRPIAVLATVGDDGDAHAVAVEVVVDGGHVYVWCESDSVKARNAARRGRSTLMAYKGQAGVMVRGPVRMIGEPDPAYREITRKFLDKYKREETFGNDLVIEIEPQRITTWE